MRSRWFAVALVCACPALALAQTLGFEADYDDEKKPWKEIEAQIPPYPKSESLILFETAPAGHQFFIDAPSVSVGTDGVVRYTLFVKTAGGAINVSYEGIRCETREQKYYAIGRAGGGWSRARDPAWRYIEAKQFNRHHGMLHGDYFCNGREPVKTARRVVDALKYGSPHPRYNIRY
ncbi:MAG: CNP1-like family protein [Betaproteobacteria bacterium]